ncbi:serine protease [Roseovarius nitratireducens]|uniref:serine protease n=1 Tax=Roseovarius nitratireducens TaxID=2044597 RepID=UPI00101AE760|nr:serine protease [Roseovarius nitratireducens]
MQSYVLPVVVAEIENGSANVKKCFGSSFVIDRLFPETKNNLILSAKHVIESAEHYAHEFGGYVAFVCKDDNGKSSRSVVARILGYEAGPCESDIVVCVTGYQTDTNFYLSIEDIEVWQEVATLGYPDEAVISGNEDGLRLNLRAQKGFVQRQLKPGDLLHRPNLTGYELSFLLAGGMSGAPIFVYEGIRDRVVGISVGTYGSETMISERTETLEDGTEFREIMQSLNRYGVAESVSSVQNWKLDMLGGKSLSDLSEA